MEGAELRAIEVTITETNEIQAVRDALRSTKWYGVIERIEYPEDFKGPPKMYVITCIAPQVGERIVPTKQLDEHKATHEKLEAFAMRATRVEARKGEAGEILEAAIKSGWSKYELQSIPFLQGAENERWWLFLAPEGTDLPTGVGRESAT